MNTTIIDISWIQVATTTLLVVITGACSILLNLKLEKDLLIGTIRTFAQLFLLGYVLTMVFALNDPLVVSLLFAFMILFAAITITGRIREKRVKYFSPVLASMFLSYVAIALFVMTAVMRVDPWYLPQYFIPLGGMIIGNSMNALAIAIDNWFEGLKKERERVELYLCLGATPVEATTENFKEAVRAGMIPSINALMSVGVVFIPGMMTGQVLAGVDPLIAVKYQIVIMLLLVGSTAISTILALHFVRKRSFSRNETLLL